MSAVDPQPITPDILGMLETYIEEAMAEFSIPGTLTGILETHWIQESLEAGAMGYLLKDIGAHELAQAIRAVHCGQPTLAPPVAQELMK